MLLMTRVFYKWKLIAKGDSALENFLSGGVGGVCAVLVGHPFGRVKVRKQTASLTVDSSSSVFGILRTILVNEGIRGIYRGVSAHSFATSSMFAVSFWGYDMSKRIVQPNRNPNTHTNHTEKRNKAKCIRPLPPLKIKTVACHRFHSLLRSDTITCCPLLPIDHTRTNRFMCHTPPVPLVLRLMVHYSL